MINLLYTTISLLLSQLNRERNMRIAITLLLTTIFLGSCSTQNYLTQTTYNTTSNNKAGFLTTKTALERPEIKLEQLQDEIFTNRAKTIEELEKITFVSNYERAVNNIILEAKTFLGTPYRYGGTNRNGIDCSSFMQQIYDVEGIMLPRVSKSQAKIGQAISKGELQKGDLIFFSTTSRYRITHVGMVTEVNADDIIFIHSASSKGVSYASLNHPYWSSRYRSARRPEKFVQPRMITMAELDSLTELASIEN